MQGWLFFLKTSLLSPPCYEQPIVYSNTDKIKNCKIELRVQEGFDSMGITPKMSCVMHIKWSHYPRTLKYVYPNRHDPFLKNYYVPFRVLRNCLFLTWIRTDIHLGLTQRLLKHCAAFVEELSCWLILILQSWLQTCVAGISVLLGKWSYVCRCFVIFLEVSQSPLCFFKFQVLSWSMEVNSNRATDGQGRQTAHIIHPMLLL